MDEKLKTIRTILDKMDIVEINELDVSKKTSICDIFIIGSMTSARQASSAVEALRLEFKNGYTFRVEGQNTDWVILDLGDIIIHLMTHQAREYYQLDELWQ